MVVTILIRVLFCIIAGIAYALREQIVEHGQITWWKFKGKFWSNSYTGNFIPFTKYRFDGKHILASIMIVSLISGYCIMEGWKMYAFLLCGYGVSYIVPFNIFWNKILKQKTK